MDGSNFLGLEPRLQNPPADVREQTLSERVTSLEIRIAHACDTRTTNPISFEELIQELRMLPLDPSVRVLAISVFTFASSSQLSLPDMQGEAFAVLRLMRTALYPNVPRNQIYTSSD